MKPQRVTKPQRLIVVPDEKPRQPTSAQLKADAEKDLIECPYEQNGEVCPIMPPRNCANCLAEEV